jgi:demethylmenaquinone methyltransferase/2-methoxy-6-polyprenyl-1,4-benzoquinol methylase
MPDPYRNIAGIYDRLFENMNKGLRLAGVRLFRPAKGMSVLDVGCGTGTHLALYQRYECKLYGIDASPSMLAQARARLGDSARLELGDASHMPFENRAFDLIISMLALHEMSPSTQASVLRECKRVLKGDGRIVLIDFAPGPYQPLQGWISKAVIYLSEIAAGRDHFRNYRRFMAAKGLAPLISQNSLQVEKQMILAGGTFAVCLVNQNTG